jgi:hypothetical protein
VAEKRRIFHKFKRRHKKPAEHSIHGLEKGGKNPKPVFIDQKPLQRDFFQSMLNAKDVDVFIKHGKEHRQMHFWDVKANGKTKEELLQQTTNTKHLAFGVEDFFKTPGFTDLSTGAKFRLVEVSVEELTGKTSDIRVVDLLARAAAVGLEPCPGKLGFEFEEMHKQELGGRQVKLVAKPAQTKDDLYFLSLQRHDETLYTNAWKVNAQHETLRANQKLIFVISS